jgi:Mrp family chromosome partitioning ATPase/DUF971 family protein
MVNSENILKALSQIIDPDFKQDIVSLGFIKNMKIDGGKVSFDIALTTPACPIKSEFQRQAEEFVKAVPGVKDVHVNMTSQPFQRPGGAETMPSTLRDVRSIIAVSSCKGGVGKSTVAAHLAQELARRGFKVGLIDADIHGPSVPTLFNLPKVEVFMNEKQQLIPIEKNGLKIMSFGFLLGDAPAVMRGPILSRYIQQILHATAWGELDYLFIDMPPGTGDVQLTITQTVRLSGAIIVTTRQTLALVDVARGILMFERVSVPILGIVENMSYFICDNCNKKHYIFGGSAKTDLEERFGLPTLAELPLLPYFSEKLENPKPNPIISETVDKVIMALGKSSLQKNEIPEIKFDAKAVHLKWKDGVEINVSNRDLRLSCRCAVCVNEITGEQILRESQIPDDIAPKEIFPLGNYAIGINWNDGHASGIYPYKAIRELALK